MAIRQVAREQLAPLRSYAYHRPTGSYGGRVYWDRASSPYERMVLNVLGDTEPVPMLTPGNFVRERMDAEYLSRRLYEFHVCPGIDPSRNMDTYEKKLTRIAAASKLVADLAKIFEFPKILGSNRTTCPSGYLLNFERLRSATRSIAEMIPDAALVRWQTDTRFEYAEFDLDMGKIPDETLEQMANHLLAAAYDPAFVPEPR